MVKRKAIDDEPNTPLSQSKVESIRNLAKLDLQLTLDPSEMPPVARRYLQSREWLTPELCQQVRCGYLPSSVKGMLRGQWVFGILDENEEVLSWVGRDLKHTEKLAAFESTGRTGKEPAKYRFPSKQYFRLSLIHI